MSKNTPTGKNGFSDAPGSAIEKRKLEHVQIVLGKQVEYKFKKTGFEEIDFEHNTLP